MYVQQVPVAAGKWQISVSGGAGSLWSRTGKEIFYVTPEDMLMVVEVKTDPSFDAGEARPLFKIPQKTSPGRKYDVSSDGQRILVNARITDEISEPVTLVLNWQAALPR